MLAGVLKACHVEGLQVVREVCRRVDEREKQLDGMALVDWVGTHVPVVTSSALGLLDLQGAVLECGSEICDALAKDSIRTEERVVGSDWALAMIRKAPSPVAASAAA